MATVLWKINTQASAASVGIIRCLVTPRSGTTSGYVAFGVVAPNGQVLKAINPAFATSAGVTGYDVVFPSITAIESAVVSIPFDSVGVYMTGNYTLHCHYIMTGTFPSGGGAPATTDELLTSYTFNVVRTSSGYRVNSGLLTASINYTTSVVTFTDATDYTGLTTAARTITSTNGAITNAVTTSTQVLAISSWITTLSAQVSLTTLLGGTVSVLDSYEIGDIYYSTAQALDYKTVVTNAKNALIAFEQKECSGSLTALDSKKRLCISENLLILLADKDLGNDTSTDLYNLNLTLR